MTRVVLCVQNMGVPDDPRVWNEATSLAAADYDVAVVAPRTAESPRAERIEAVDVVRYWCPHERPGVVGQLLEAGAGFLGTARAVTRLRRRGTIDVLHVANPPDTLFPLAWWLRRSGTCFVYDQHDPAPELLAAKLGRRPVLDRVLRLLERATYHAADLVIVGNNSCRRLVVARSGLPAERVITVRLGPRSLEPAAGDAAAMPTVIYAGVMGAQDTVELLLDGFARVLRRRPGGAQLVLVGRGDAVEDLQRRAAELGIGDHVTWTGWLSRAEMRRRLGAATVGVSPDVDDPYTRISTMIKISEYLACGLPAIVADLPENRATGEDGALYFRPGDAEELGARLEEVLFDPDRRDELADAARRRAHALLWRHSVPRLLAAYRELLDGGPAPEGDQHVGALAATG